MTRMRVTGFVCRGTLRLNGGMASKIDFVFVFYICVLFFPYVFLSISLSCFLITVTCFLFTRLVSIPVYCLLFRSQRLCLVFHRRQTVATRFFESLTSTAWAFDDRTRPVRSPPKLNFKKSERSGPLLSPHPHRHLLGEQFFLLTFLREPFKNYLADFFR